MADYKRLVSYIYTYDGEKKMKNVGFAKIDSRGGQCKVVVNLKGVSTGGLKVYLFKREDDKLVGIQLGHFRPVNGSGEFRELTVSGNIEGSGYSLDEMGGLYICENENSNKVFASEWDDIPVIPQNFIDIKDFLRNGNYEDKIVQETLNMHAKDFEDPIVEMMKQYVLENNIAGIDVNEVSQVEKPKETTPFQEPDQPAPGAYEEDDEQADNNPENDRSEEPEQEPNGSDASQPEEPYKEPTEEEDQEGNRPYRQRVYPEESVWDYFFQNYPKVKPCVDCPEMVCIKIKPHDLARFPRRYWVLGNNSFLLHGYYNYRYLILGKVGDGDETQYIIGVPGVYHGNEKVMASMFGFTDFMRASEGDQPGGKFGYWYRTISLD